VSFEADIRAEQEFYSSWLAQEEREYLAEGGGIVFPEGFSARLTCACVPEQWDILYDGQMIGYLRCRHSRWSLIYPDVGGEVLIQEPWHPERGKYESNFDEERPAIFQRVFRALVERHTSR